MKSNHVVTPLKHHVTKHLCCESYKVHDGATLAELELHGTFSSQKALFTVPYSAFSGQVSFISLARTNNNTPPLLTKSKNSHIYMRATKPKEKGQIFLLSRLRGDFFREVRQGSVSNNRGVGIGGKEGLAAPEGQSPNPSF